MRFVTDAVEIAINIENCGLVKRADMYNATAAVFVDGKLKQTHDCGDFSSKPQQTVLRINHEGRAPRLHEILMPYAASIKILGISLSNALMYPVPKRPKTLYVAYGDSTTQGFNSNDVSNTWPFLLAHANDWRLINLGVGGLRASGEHGHSIGQLNPQIATVLMGYNNFISQTPINVFQGEIEATLNNILVNAPKCRIFVITPLWAFRAAKNPIRLEAYREAIRQAVSKLQGPQIKLIEGESLTPKDRLAFPDGTHPSDYGSNNIFLSLIQKIPANPE